jgi:hypothetical protein
MESPRAITTIDPSLDVVVIGDLHIGDGSRTEAFRNKDVELRRFLSDAVARSDVLVIAGDGFVLRDGRATVYDWRRKTRIDDDEYRGVLGAHQGKTFFDWWERYYRGWFRYDVEAMTRDARGA